MQRQNGPEVRAGEGETFVFPMAELSHFRSSSENWRNRENSQNERGGGRSVSGETNFFFFGIEVLVQKIRKIDF